MSLNEDIRDELIPHDLLVRRAIAGVDREINARLNRLAVELRALLYRLDPAGTNRPDARQRRAAKWNVRATELTRQAFVDIERLTREANKRFAYVEAKGVSDIINAEVEKLLGGA